MSGRDARVTRLWNGRLGTVLRGGLAVLPLVWISRRVAWHEVGLRLRELGAPSMLLAISFALVSFFLGSLRWRVLLVGYGARAVPSVWRLFADTLIGAYWNLMPGGIAGEAVRGYRVRESVEGLATSYAILLVDRLAGLAGLMVLALASALVGPPLPVRGVDWAMGIAALLGLALAFGALGLPYLLERRPALLRLVLRVPFVGPKIASVKPVRRASSLLLAVLVSIGTQAAAVMMVVTLVLSLAPATPALGVLRVAPLVTLLIFVPLTPGGVGQREAVFLEVFGAVGAPASAAVAASVLTFGIALIVAATGGLLLLRERLRPRPREGA